MRWSHSGGPGRRRRAAERDVARELRDHLDLEAEAQQQDGVGPQEARRAARLLFGNPAVVEEDVRAVLRPPWWERLVQDARYALRTFRRSPVFTITAVISVAVGIGASTAMFTLINAALLRRLPVNRPDQLAVISTPDGFSYPVYQTLAAGNRSLAVLVAASSSNRAVVDIGVDTHLSDVKMVSANYFDGLGVLPTEGRLFNAAEDAEPLAVVSHRFWRTHYDASPKVVGQLLRIGGTTVSVVGVAPRGFFGESPGESPDIWTTVALQPQQIRNERGFTWLRILGRLRPGVTLAQAEAEIKALAGNIPVVVLPGERGTSGLRQRFAGPLTVLSGMVGLVLLIACTNVAGLLLTRGAARRPEMAVRLALGAGRGRIVRQLMTENLLMAAVGGGIGLLLSFWATGVLVRLAAGAGQILAIDVRPDAGVLVFVAVLSVCTSVLFGLFPALRTASGRAEESLLSPSRSIAGPERRWSLHDAFIVTQLSLSLVLLAGAAMLVRTLLNLQGQDLGVRAENLIVANISADRGYRPRLAVVLPELIAQVRLLPGVQSASVASFGTLANQGGIQGLAVDGYTPRAESDQRARVDYVGPDYLRTAGIRLIAGREFTWADQAGSRPVAIVNQTMARFYFGVEDVTGRRFRFNKNEYEIVGVAGDAKYNDLRETTTPRFVYFAALQSGTVRSLEIRTSGATPSVAALRSLVRDVDPRLSIGEVLTMEERIGRKIGQERMVASLASFFGALTLLLASVGVYGTIAYSMERRTKEIGVRLALGSRRAAIISLVLRHVAAQVAAAVLVGTVALLASGRLLTSLLFGVPPADAATIAIAAGLLGTVALAAASIPSIRTSRLDLAVVLRE